MPKLSIITINLNNSSGLRKTINSVVEQTFNDYEYLIIDGGSNDGSVEIIKEYKKNITYWISEPDKGIYNAMNKGIIKSSAEYLLFLNSGDFLFDEKVLESVFNLDSYGSHILYGDYVIVYRDFSKNVSFNKIKINLEFLYYSNLGHPACFFRRDLFDHDYYDENLRMVSDWKFLIKKIVLENKSLYYVNVPISCFDTSGVSNNPEFQHIIAQERKQVLNEFFPPLMLENIIELHELISFKPVKHILEFRNYSILGSLIFGFNRLVLRSNQKLISLKNQLSGMYFKNN